MREAVIVEAVRTPIARGKPGVGDLCDFHATHLLALSYRELLRRSRPGDRATSTTSRPAVSPRPANRRATSRATPG